MHENHASIVALHRLKTFFKKSADTFASTQYFNGVTLHILRPLLRPYDGPYRLTWVGTTNRWSCIGHTQP